jgi:hypothetical protein
MRIRRTFSPHGAKWAWVAIALAAAGLAVVGGAAFEGLHAQDTRGISQLLPMATTDPISVAGYGPGDVALSWQQSGDWCFTDYRLQDSTTGSGGPWTTVDTITSSGSDGLYWYGFNPGETLWFQDIDDSGCGGGSATSNVVSVTFPSYATVTYVDSGPSTVQLSWNNNAHYGGLLSFESYQVEENINNAGFSVLSTITSQSTNTYTVPGVTGLNTGTTYQFRIATTDQCNNCQGGSYPYTTDSNSVTHLTIDAPVATPTSVQTGSTIQFSISVTGGTSPYAFDWTGLPAGCSSSSTAQLSCRPTSPGTYNVAVTVTDSRGSTLTSLSVTVTVTGSGGSSLLGGNGSGGSPLPSVGWLLVALALIVAVVLAVVLLARRRRSTPPDDATGSGQAGDEPMPPPSPPAATAPGGGPSSSCTLCGSFLRPGAQFCAGCGTAVRSRDSGSISPSQATQRSG